MGDFPKGLSKQQTACVCRNQEKLGFYWPPGDARPTYDDIPQHVTDQIRELLKPYKKLEVRNNLPIIDPDFTEWIRYRMMELRGTLTREMLEEQQSNCNFTVKAGLVGSPEGNKREIKKGSSDRDAPPEPPKERLNIGITAREEDEQLHASSKSQGRINADPSLKDKPDRFNADSDEFSFEKEKRSIFYDKYPTTKTSKEERITLILQT